MATNAEGEFIRLARDRRLSRQIPTLPEILRCAGFTTAAFDTLSGWTYHPNWFSRGYEFYINVARPFTPTYKLHPHLLVDAQEVNHRLIPWLEQNYKEQFFLHIHYWDPHQPYSPPAKYRQIFENDCFFNQIRQVSQGEYLPGCGLKQYISKTEQKSINCYDGEIAYVDDKIGQVLKKLQSLNIYQNSLIIVTADHGEIMVEDEPHFTHTTVREADTHVPLIMKMPQGKYGGQRIRCLAEHVDIVPTILNLCGLELRNIKVDGNSLLPVIKSEEKQVKSRVYSFGNYFNGVPCRAMWFEKWKFIKNYIGMHQGTPNWFPRSISEMPERELYNLEDDLEELKNLAFSEKERTDQMEKQLSTWISKYVGYPSNDPILERH